MKIDFENFIQTNSPDGGFLQSGQWRKFQEATGKKTFNITGDGFYANIIEHSLPVVRKYFYIPRGPIIKSQISNLKSKNLLDELIDLAKKNNIGWIRIEPATENTLGEIKKNLKHKITKAPHDMQPKELFIIDINKSEEQLLAEMKPKARYNIRLAERKGVSLRIINDGDVDEFLRLTKVMATRNGIVTHPESYYRKMLEIIPSDILKLYIAEYQGKIIAANLVVFYGSTCTYLHGASDDEYRNVMAPYLLQWKQIQDAKNAGCERYDFGGVKMQPHPSPLLRKEREKNEWAGITKFKTGFSPNTSPVVFPGSFDIILNRKKYWLYRLIQRAKNFVK